MSIRCLVIGVGKMGFAHLQVLAALSPEALAGWAPSERRRESVESAGAEFLQGSLEAALGSFRPTHVIIASPVETLSATALQVIAAGVRFILLEKPAALNVAEGQRLAAAASATGTQVFVGYNRRFYASVRTALAMIRESGDPISSVLFEFNEVVGSADGPPGHAPVVQSHWLLANSLHVIDTALFPVGRPASNHSEFSRSGSLSWHPSGAIFVGAGETEQGIPFAYHANWNAPGRWGFEWMTPSARYVFRPLEKLSIMRRGSFALEEVALDDALDQRFKPGVYLQNQAFLAGDRSAGLVSLQEALDLIPLGASIGGYQDALG